MKKILALLIIALAFLPSALTAQAATKAQVVLAFVEDELEMSISDATGTLVVKEGMTIPLGAVITTKKTTAELQLLPNKTIIKLSNKTTFTVKTLKEANGAGSNDFALAAGKIRTVAAKLSGSKDPGYNFSTPTANCGVRGTDFAMMYDLAAKKDWVCVQEGLVDFTNITSGATVPVAKGQFANTFDTVFAAAAVGADQLAELFSDVDFVKLNPTDVPGKEIAQTAQETPAQTTESADSAAAAPAKDDPVTEFLKKVFGMEVGSVTIDGTTYSKAVLSPTVAFDGFKLGLYLPIIYTSDMFNPSDWYHPEGNDEWSFGSDKQGVWSKTGDILNDLALKIKFLEWGVQGQDPFYLKVGSLQTMTLGHGTIVHNFANDQDFPAVRKIGLNAGVKFGGVSVEGLADDVAKPAVVGGRLAFDLIGDQVALGLQAVADLKLADSADLSSLGKSPAGYGDPVLVVGGLDLQLFRVNAGGLFRTTAFADVNTLALYVRKAPGDYTTSVGSGFSMLPIFHDGELGSFGGESGFYGNVAIVDYRLSFQVERGLYTNGIFQGNYYRSRNGLLESTAKYVYGDSADRSEIDEALNMGVYGDFGFDVGLFSLKGAYRWPFMLDGGAIKASDSDYFKVGLDIPKGKIPFIDVSGGVTYERTQFVSSIRDGVSLFDANTVLRGMVRYGLTQGLDLVLGVGTSTARNADGNVIYEDGKPKVAPTVSIDTKIAL